MTGKGSAPRPLSVSDEEFGKRFDAIDWSDRLVEGCDILRSEGVMGFVGKPSNVLIEDGRWQDDPMHEVFTEEDGKALRAMAWAKGTIPDFMGLSIDVASGAPWFTLSVPCDGETVRVHWPERQCQAASIAAAARTCETRGHWLKFIADRGVEGCIAKAWQSASVRMAMHANGAKLGGNSEIVR